jgi:uncharacterized protein
MSHSLIPFPMTELAQKRDRLLALIQSYGSCAVAFSAGVDSTVVAKAARLALGDDSVAITGDSPSLAEGELAESRRLAKLIGIRHVVIQTDEHTQPDYLRNAPDRCYHCKTELFTKIAGMLDDLGAAVIVSGANADDADDYRPGMQAAREQRVRSPLLECGITKAELRELAAEWKLPVWDKPAMPCLASRIAYGVEATPERMAMVDGAERYLRSLGFREVRVRYHHGDVARIEVPADTVPSLCRSPMREEVIAELKMAGFKFVSLDLEGFRSGSLNTLVPLELLTQSTAES